MKVNESLKIVVLAGGISSERAVSLVSGSGVCRALRTLGHQAILLDPFVGWADADPAKAFDGQNAFATDGQYDVDAALSYIHSFDEQYEEMKASRKSFFGPRVLELCNAADFVFLALHGVCGEDGRIQAAFDLMGIPYSGTGYVSSALAMDKSLSRSIFQMKGLPVARGVSITRKDQSRTAEDYGLELPVIVKPCLGGSSLGCTICTTNEQLKEGIALALSLEEGAVIEEFIIGREFTVFVLEDKAYPIVEIAPKEGYYDYSNKYTAGSTIETCPADLSVEKTKEMQELARQGGKALGITSYARLDFMMRTEDQKIFLLEANTLPGMTPTSLIPREAAAVGISYEKLCQMLIDSSLRARGGKNG